jgi:RNA polymerase-binding protein DksA
MSAKSKKTVAKKPAAKPVAKKPAAKKPAAKPVAKKPAAKKPAAKPAAKKPAAKKPAAKPVAKPPAEPVKEKKEIVRKPITVVKKVPRPPLRKAEVPVVFENQSQAVAFSFAEMMKKRQREMDASRKQTTDATVVKLARRPTSRTRGETSQQFPASDLAEFRKRLILLRQEAMGQSATLRTNALEHTDDRGSEDDDGSDAFMRLQNLSQVDSQNKIIQKIDEALARIQDGTYGICEICGQLIRKPRLLNLPFVHTCMECQSAMEANPMGMR